MILPDDANRVRTREEFLVFLRALGRDLSDNPTSWENTGLESFLGALAAWIEDMDGYYAQRGKPTPHQPDWSTVANMLMAAKIYE